MRRHIVFATMLLAMCTKAHAYFLNGDALYNQCLFHREEATATVIGMSDAYVNIFGPDRRDPVFFCLRPGTTASDITDVVCNYLKAHPDTRNSPACTLAFTALNATFPCQAEMQ